VFLHHRTLTPQPVSFSGYVCAGEHRVPLFSFPLPLASFVVVISFFFPLLLRRLCWCRNDIGDVVGDGGVSAFLMHHSHCLLSAFTSHLFLLPFHSMNLLLPSLFVSHVIHCQFECGFCFFPFVVVGSCARAHSDSSINFLFSPTSLSPLMPPFPHVPSHFYCPISSTSSHRFSVYFFCFVSFSYAYPPSFAPSSLPPSSVYTVPSTNCLCLMPFPSLCFFFCATCFN